MLDDTDALIKQNTSTLLLLHVLLQRMMTDLTINLEAANILKVIQATVQDQITLNSFYFHNQEDNPERA